MDLPRRINSPTSSSESTHKDSIDKSSLGSTVRDSSGTGWTDEKHSMYLKSMEASFVKQLYNSVTLLSSPSENEKLSSEVSSRQIRFTSPAPPDQFKIIRRGYLRRINFQKPGIPCNDESRRFLASPWIRRYKPVAKPGPITAEHHKECATLEDQAICLDKKDITPAPCQPGSAAGTRLFYGFQSDTCAPNVIHSNEGLEEVSDQNFVEESTEKTNSSESSKKMKVTTSNGLHHHDQVVPDRTGLGSGNGYNKKSIYTTR